MVSCPHCGGETFASKIKCSNCGGRIADAPREEFNRDPSMSFLPDTIRAEPSRTGMRSVEVAIDTAGQRVVDITDAVREFATECGQSGLINVFLPHATAGIALMETGAGSEDDITKAIDDWLPPADRYRHRHGARGHGRDHLLPVFISPSLSIPVEDGRLFLGTWQSVVLVDTNQENNRRRVRLSFLPG